MVKHPKEFFTCKYNKRSGFWDTGDRKNVPYVWGNTDSPPQLPTTSHPPNPKMTETWQSCNRPASVRYTFPTGKGKYGSAQQNYHLNKHILFLHASNHNSDYCKFLPYGFAYTLKISPNFRMCSNLEQATHHMLLQCRQFVLHGLAYLLSTSRTWHYIQPTYNEGLCQSQSWSYVLQLYHTHFLCPMCQYRTTMNCLAQNLHL
jgi:hypothetical protein